MIRLVGPGGAGKTTIGLALANRLDRPFVDLDAQFNIRAGDISAYLRERLPFYLSLPMKKFETNAPIQAVVDDLVTYLPGLCLEETTSG